VLEKAHPRMSEAALIAGTNPEVDEAGDGYSPNDPKLSDSGPGARR
jgi:hypothetical protein